MGQGLGRETGDRLRAKQVETPRQLHVRPLHRHSDSGVFYLAHRNDSRLDFDSMDEFMNEIIAALEDHGARAIRVFPPDANVLLSFADRLANEVVSTVRFM